jgi:hypothetical protein
LWGAFLRWDLTNYLPEASLKLKFLLISASRVARITGMSHQQLAKITVSLSHFFWQADNSQVLAIRACNLATLEAVMGRILDQGQPGQIV